MDYQKILLPAKRNHTFSVCIAVLVALFPKCPLCWSAYASLFSAFGVVSFPYYDWILPLMLAFLFINLFALGIIAKKRKLYAPFYLSLMGAVAIVCGKLWTNSNLLLHFGVLLIVASSLWNVLTKASACKGS